MAAKRSKSKTALRGAVNNIIMESLFSGEKYGYEIIKEVEEKTNGKIKLKQPSLYSSLKRFETKGYIESHWQDSDIGGKRHYYKLTPSGLTYYKKHVAKNYDDDYEEDDDLELLNNDTEEFLEDQLNTGYEIDEHEEVSDLTKYEYNVEDKLNSLLGIEPETQKELLDELYQEIEEDEVLTEDDIIQEPIQEELPDHEFRSPTPMTSISENEIVDITDNALNDIIVDEEENKDVFSDIDLNTIDVTPAQPAEPVKIITDSDGITKMYYESEEKKPSNKVFDNVVYRTASQDIYSSINNKRHEKEEVLTDEEKELKAKRFFEKFDNKSEQIIKEKQLARASQPKTEVADNTPIDYSYKSKLNNLFDTMGVDDDEEDNIQNNNPYNSSYELDEDEFITLPAFDNDESDEEVFYEDEEDIPSKISSPIIERDKDYTMKLYTEEKTKHITKKYLQVNKAKFSFGLVMLLFMLLQVTTMLIVFKNQNLLMDNQFWVFQLSYIIVGIVALVYCVPVFVSPNKQSSNSFKIGYSLMFGFLAFFIVVILAYAINTFMGMELFNLQYYLATLIVPIVLSLNFVFGPLIYWVITQNKSLY